MPKRQRQVISKGRVRGRIPATLINLCDPARGACGFQVVTVDEDSIASSLLS